MDEALKNTTITMIGIGVFFGIYWLAITGNNIAETTMVVGGLVLGFIMVGAMVLGLWEEHICEERTAEEYFKNRRLGETANDKN